MLVLLHLSDALDIINHDILQDHLKLLGVGDMALSWFVPPLLWLISLKDTAFLTNFEVLVLIHKYLYSLGPASLKE